jgi:hypothetical protein
MLNVATNSDQNIIPIILQLLNLSNISSLGNLIL